MKATLKMLWVVFWGFVAVLGWVLYYTTKNDCAEGYKASIQKNKICLINERNQPIYFDTVNSDLYNNLIKDNL